MILNVYLESLQPEAVIVINWVIIIMLNLELDC